MSDRDSGVSVVIAFVTILVIVAMAVGMWALVGIPGQIREANEAHVVYIADSMTDYKVMLQNINKAEFTGLNVSTLMPVGASYSPGQIFLNDTTVGRLSVTTTISDGLTSSNSFYWSQDVNMFILTVGSGTVIGYEGGGIFRSEMGNSVWLVYPEFTIKNISDNRLYISLGNISNISGDFSVGASGNIPLNTRYMSSNNGYNKFEGVKNTIPELNHIETMTISYTSIAKEDASLWYSLFYETYYKYTLSGMFKDYNLSVSYPSLTNDGKTVSISITSYDIPAYAFLSGYTYNADLVPDHVVKVAVDESDLIITIKNEKYKIIEGNLVYLGSWSDYRKTIPEDGVTIYNGSVFYDEDKFWVLYNQEAESLVLGSSDRNKERVSNLNDPVIFYSIEKNYDDSLDDIYVGFGGLYANDNYLYFHKTASGNDLETDFIKIAQKVGGGGGSE